MDKKAERYGLFAAAVLLIIFFLSGPIYDVCSRRLSFEVDLSGNQKFWQAAEKLIKPNHENLPSSGKKIPAAGTSTAVEKVASQTDEEQNPPDDTVFWRRFLDKVNEMITHIRKLILGEGQL